MEILVCVLFIGIFMYTEAEMSTSAKISPTSTQLYQTSGYYNSLQTSNNSYNSVKYYLTSGLTSATIQPSSLKTWSSTFNSSTLSIVSTYQQNFRSASSLSHYSELSTLNGSKASITIPTSYVMTIEYRTSEHKSEISPTIYSSVSSDTRIPRSSDIKLTSTSVQPQVNSTVNGAVVPSHSSVHLSSIMNQNCSENCHKNDNNKNVPGHTSTAVIIILVFLVIIFAVIGLACYRRRRQICGSLGLRSSSASYKRFVDEDREGVNLNAML